MNHFVQLKKRKFQVETRDCFFVALFSKSLAHPEIDFCSANKRPGAFICGGGAFIRKTPVHAGGRD